MSERDAHKQLKMEIKPMMGSAEEILLHAGRVALGSRRAKDFVDFAQTRLLMLLLCVRIRKNKIRGMKMMAAAEMCIGIWVFCP